MSEKSSRSRRLVWFLGLGVLLTYVGINIVAVSYVPLLHRLEIDLSVVDGRSGSAVPDATVSWLHSGPDGRTKSEAVGTTGSSGRASVVRMIRDQPTWAFPRIGSIRFGDLSLGVTADGYDDSQEKLSKLLPSLPYSNPRAELTIQLDRASSSAGETGERRM